MKIKAIITDWHGVIDIRTFAGFVELLSKEVGQNPTDCKKKIKQVASAWTLGTMDSQLFWIQLQSLFLLSDQQLQKLQDYLLHIEFYEPMVEFLEMNKSKYKLVLLSDCPQDKAEVIKLSKVFPLFQAARFSCDVQMGKESSQFITNFLAELALEPGECLYVDDGKDHVEMAAKLGMQTCHFKSMSDLTPSMETYQH